MKLHEIREFIAQNRKLGSTTALIKACIEADGYIVFANDMRARKALREFPDLRVDNVVRVEQLPWNWERGIQKRPIFVDLNVFDVIEESQHNIIDQATGHVNFELSRQEKLQQAMKLLQEVADDEEEENIRRRNEQRAEIVRCGQDPIYFINKYCKIRHPKLGIIDFKTYHYQDNCINSFQDHRANIILKARQLGISTLAAAYALWLALFHKDKIIRVITHQLSMSNNFMKKTKIMLDNLPNWLQLCGNTPHACDIEFDNGSSIVASSSDCCHSCSCSLLIFDEAAWIEKLRNTCDATFPTVEQDGKIIVYSSLSNKDNGFKKMYFEGCVDWRTVCIKLPWNVHPEHDKEWFDNATRFMSEDDITREFMCEFV